MFTDQQRSEYDLYYAVDELLKKKFGKHGGPKFVHLLYQEILTRVVEHAMMFGLFKFPGRAGAFRMVRRRASYYKKDGQTIRRPPTAELIFTEGDALKGALGRPSKRPVAKPVQHDHVAILGQLVNDLARETHE